MKKRTWFDAITRETKWSSKYARAAVYAVGFGLICAFILTLFTGSYNGTCYGLIFGMLFGVMFASISRWIARHIGEGGILWYGFAGILSGALTKIICTPIANEVLSAVYGRIESPVQLAFYAVVCAAYLGGFFGLFQSLIFGRSVAIQDIQYDESFKRDQTSELSERSAKELPEPMEVKRNE